MNFKNNQFWFWGFLILAVLIISAASTIGYKAYKHHHTSFHTNMGHATSWKNMDFDIEQIKFIKKTRIKHRKTMHALKGQQAKIHNKLFTEISKQEPNNELIAQYKDSTLYFSTKIMNKTIKYYETLKTELSEEQMSMLNKHISKRFCKSPARKRKINQ